jgi:haloalkane dehalogenase
MEFVRTPEARFENLPDFPYQANYLTINDLRIHYLDEGQGETILCLHGEPSWSFLYRKMVKVLAPKHRVIAPDLAGFGKSDKPSSLDDYTYHFHLDILLKLIEQLNLDKITFVVQDWGGLLGLRVASLIPEKVARLVIMNTFLPTGEEAVGQGFMNWLNFVKSTPDLPIGKIFQMSMATPNTLPAEIEAAYNAPFPDASYKAGARKFPLLVPITPDTEAGNEMKQAREVIKNMHKPALIMFSDKDPVTGNGKYLFYDLIEEKYRRNVDIKDAGHFLQEEKGEELAEHIAQFMADFPI